jgi:ASC-1-like (ASCH) protein
MAEPRYLKIIMTAQYSFFLDPLKSAVNARETETKTRDRVFVPLAKAPFRWFASGHKSWELRRRGRQYTQKHLIPGRRVELRCGYSDKRAALWGRISEVREAESLSQFFDAVDFREVIPEAASRAEAMETAADILGEDTFPVIGFRIEADPVTELLLHADFVPLVRAGKKRSTVRKGIRRIESTLADLVTGTDRLRVLVTDLDVKTFNTLSTMDAQRDGFDTLADLQRALRHFYPEITQSDPVTIIGFEPLIEWR